MNTAGKKVSELPARATSVARSLLKTISTICRTDRRGEGQSLHSPLTTAVLRSGERVEGLYLPGEADPWELARSPSSMWDGYDPPACA
jgi:hypothetical protein